MTFFIPAHQPPQHLPLGLPTCYSPCLSSLPAKSNTFPSSELKYTFAGVPASLTPGQGWTNICAKAPWSLESIRVWSVCSGTT